VESCRQAALEIGLAQALRVRDRPARTFGTTVTGKLTDFAPSKGTKGLLGLTPVALVVALLGPSPAVAAPAPNPWWQAYYEHSKYVLLPDGRRMRLYCEGAGSPTVVLDSGLGSDATDWRTVQDSIAHTTRVCSYDRAGLGGSDPGPMPRDAAARASDMEQMLVAAKVRGPYVLVGHSLGSYDLQLFADVYRRKVAGMVLVDPATAPEGLKVVAPPPGPIQTCMKLGGSGQLRPDTPAYDQCVVGPPPDMPPALAHTFIQERLRPAPWQAWAAEADAMILDVHEVTIDLRPLGDMPLIVLTHGNLDGPPDASPEELAETAAFLYKQHQVLADLSTRGVHRVVPNSDHVIQWDAPQAVIDAVDEVVTEARRQ
jgi:pimeloyl-ACP methyl ester carboxylesterase